MIDSIRRLGETVLTSGGDFLESLVQEINVPEGEKRFIVHLDLASDPFHLTVDAVPLDSKHVQEALWVGNASAMDAQDRLTSSTLGYLISQTIPNLLKPDRLREGDLRNRLQHLVSNAFIDLGDKAEVFASGGGDGQYERYRRVWNLPLLGIASLETLSKTDAKTVQPLLDQGLAFLSRDFLRAAASSLGSAKSVVSLVERALSNWIAAETDLKSRDIALYTLRLDGMLLAAHPDYHDYLQRRFLGEVFEGKPVGVCHACGASEATTDNTKWFRLQKFYNTDKIGFASRLDEKQGFARAYQLCQACYRNLLVGERFAANQLRTSLARNPVYLIPDFHLPVQFSAKRLQGLAEYLRARVSAMRTLNAWQEFEGNLQKYQEFENEKASYLIHFLFTRQAQSEVRILKLISEVPSSRLDQINDVRDGVWQWGETHWGESPRWDLGWATLFYLFPIRLRGQEPKNVTIQARSGRNLEPKRWRRR